MHHTDAKEQFLAPPPILPNPGPAYGAATRRFQGIPSVACSPGGRLWAIWYGGPGDGEDHTNYVMLASSADGGDTWSEETLIIDPDGNGPVRAFDPEVWLDPNGRLWAFWAQTIGHVGTVAGVWAVTTDTPDDATPRWSTPHRLTDGVMMCKPIVLSSNEWVLATSTWRETDHSARMVVSIDQGHTWALRGACQVPREVREFDEHIIVERTDGTLWMLVRTNYGIGESISTDRGHTWGSLTRSALEHPSSRFFVRRLASGRLLLVKHGPLGERTGREDLRAYLSDDEGHTWHGGLLLDERLGVSYPDGIQLADGTICVIYDYSRRDAREILMARFTEEDVATGDMSSDVAATRLLVNKAGPIST